jgi:hypothetical protein
MQGQQAIQEQATERTQEMVSDFLDTADDMGARHPLLLVLVGIKAARERLEVEQEQAVANARARGPYSWEAIGDALGISKQAAAKRYSGE